MTGARRTAGRGDLERAVMDSLWAHPEGASVRDVQSRLDTGLAYTTVMTVLDRLAKKGLVRRERDGRAWRYHPAATREEQTAQALRATLGGVPAGERRETMLHFLVGSSPDELAELRSVLAELEHRQDPEG